MLLLLAVSFIWALSFGLVKRLGGLDPTAVACVRLLISLLVFLPFLRTGPLGAGRMARLAAIGALQFGAMYILYLRSYAYLHAYEVALFTITTPILVTLIDAAVERRWSTRFAVAAALSVGGAAVLVWKSAGDSGLVRGFAFVQLSNLCFAGGQVAWRRIRPTLPVQSGDLSVFALPYAGALALALAASVLSGSWRGFSPDHSQWLILAYLGAVASGAGFFLWNVGATRVNAGVLAAFNNAKVPLGVACSLLFFGERADIPRLLLGGALMALAVWTARFPAGS